MVPYKACYVLINKKNRRLIGCEKNKDGLWELFEITDKKNQGLWYAFNRSTAVAICDPKIKHKRVSYKTPLLGKVNIANIRPSLVHLAAGSPSKDFLRSEEQTERDAAFEHIGLLFFKYVEDKHHEMASWDFEYKNKSLYPNKDAVCSLLHLMAVAGNRNIGEWLSFTQGNPDNLVSMHIALRKYDIMQVGNSGGHFAMLVYEWWDKQMDEKNLVLWLKNFVFAHSETISKLGEK